MIRYQLRCTNDHDFEGWFRDSSSYDEQKGNGLLSCPSCGSEQVEKAIMAPSIHQVTKHEMPSVEPQEVVAGGSSEALIQKLKSIKELLLKDSTDVGEKFCDEARAMHYNEKPQKQIHGIANHEDVEALNEEGVGVLAVPRLPDDLN